MGRPTHKVPRQNGRTSFSSLVTLARWQLRQTWRLLLIAGIGIIAAVLLVCAISVSRIYLGVHYPTDVAAGMALGAAWITLLLAVLKPSASGPDPGRVSSSG